MPATFSPPYIPTSLHSLNHYYIRPYITAPAAQHCCHHVFLTLNSKNILSKHQRLIDDALLIVKLKNPSLVLPVFSL